MALNSLQTRQQRICTHHQGCSAGNKACIPADIGCGRANKAHALTAQACARHTKARSPPHTANRDDAVLLENERHERVKSVKSQVRAQFGNDFN